MRADWIKLMIGPIRDSGQRGLGTGAHIHGLGSEPDSVDADHWASSRTKRAQPSGSDIARYRSKRQQTVTFLIHPLNR
jgi:hypothetical protein